MCQVRASSRHDVSARRASPAPCRHCCSCCSRLARLPVPVGRAIWLAGVVETARTFRRRCRRVCRRRRFRSSPRSCSAHPREAGSRELAGKRRVGRRLHRQWNDRERPARLTTDAREPVIIMQQGNRIKQWLHVQFIACNLLHAINCTCNHGFTLRPRGALPYPPSLK